jgi:glutathione S-transferase
MRLYWSRLSPYVRKVMVVAHEVGLAADIECMDTEVSMSAANRDLLPINPLGQIPALVLTDGTTLHDSRVICEYLDATADGGLFPAPPARWDALRRHALGDGIMDALIVWRQERLKPAERQTQAWLDTFALKIATALDQLEHTSRELQAAPFDIGHVAIGCALGYLDVRFGDLAWRTGRPALAEWHAWFEARSAARATAPGDAA